MSETYVVNYPYLIVLRETERLVYTAPCEYAMDIVDRAIRLRPWMKQQPDILAVARAMGCKRIAMKKRVIDNLLQIHHLALAFRLNGQPA